MRTISTRDLHPMSKTNQIKKSGTAKPKPQEATTNHGGNHLVQTTTAKAK